VKDPDVQKSFVEKLGSARKLLYSRFPQLTGRDLCQAIGKLAHYHYNKRDFILLGEDRELYSFLVESGINPFTFYRWLLLERVPEDIRFQLKQGQISQKNAVSEAFRRRHETEQSLGEKVRAMGLCLIGRM
jgi:hypothetical protein